MNLLIKLFSISILFTACENHSQIEVLNNEVVETPSIINEEEVFTEVKVDTKSWNDTDFVNILELSDQFVLDMKYATTDNFIGEKVYDCPDCYLRYAVIQSLIIANNDFIDNGVRIKFFDCYRPLDIQKRMWEILPDGRYVANPNKSGSIHNRGGAVDITLVDSTGKELDMGTSFDHFGKEAHHDYEVLNDTIKKNRNLLKEVMEKNGFKSLRTEWWHYSYQSHYNLSNSPIKCE
ncbi:MAG: peptidase M15 [Flavobacteriales bacterium]|nr:MAG: peptidase M15 [Flavobacteriales bacterium]